MGPFESGAALHRPTPPGYISSANITGKSGATVRMNVSACQEENKRTGNKEAGEERKQAPISKTECCPSAVVQRAAERKMVCVREMPGVTGTLGKAKSHFHLTQTGSGTAPPR